MTKYIFQKKNSRPEPVDRLRVLRRLGESCWLSSSGVSRAAISWTVFSSVAIRIEPLFVLDRLCGGASFCSAPKPGNVTDGTGTGIFTVDSSVGSLVSTMVGWEGVWTLTRALSSEVSERYLGSTRVLPKHYTEYFQKYPLEEKVGSKRTNKVTRCPQRQNYFGYPFRPSWTNFWSNGILRLSISSSNKLLYSYCIWNSGIINNEN